jgi:Protein of unknown function (DUF3175)
MVKAAQHQRSSKDNRYWSAEITRDSDALDLEHSVFTWSDPKRIARSLKSSAEASERRKAGPYQAAMSMLNFYINRAGKNLSRGADKSWIRRRSNCAACSGESSRVCSFRGPSTHA